MTPFTCGLCGEPVLVVKDRFEQRAEFVRVDRKERLRVKTVRHLCRACVPYAAGDKHPGQQGLAL